MITFLLVLIFAAFVSLGLPDSLFGAAWPSISASTETSNVLGGIYSFIASSATIVTSALAGRLIKRFGTGKVVVASILLTAAALTVMPLAVDAKMPFFVICIVGFGLGLGGGAVDTALNSYVALHFSERVMSWLHCVFGLGTAASPFIYSIILNYKGNWEEGYLAVAAIQIVIAAALLFAMPLWGKVPLSEDAIALEDIQAEQSDTSRFRDILKIPGMCQAGIAFHYYCGFEAVAGLWAATYMYKIRGFGLESSARCTSLFYLGITAGRFISGLIGKRFGAKFTSAIGALVSLVGAVLLFSPIPDGFAVIALFLIGFGAGPLYPGLMYKIPRISGAKDAAAATGLSMVFAYTGYTVFPAITGFLPVEQFPLIILVLLFGSVFFGKSVYKIKPH